MDDGLELRKAAFECVDTLLDSCLDQVNPSSFIVPYLKSGLDGEHLFEVVYFLALYPANTSVVSDADLFFI